MSDKKLSIGSVVLENIKNSKVEIGPIAIEVKPNGDIVAGDKYTIVNLQSPVFNFIVLSSIGISFLLGVALILSLLGNFATMRQPGGALAAFWPLPTATPTPIPPMPSSGFNLAVAQFSSLNGAVSDEASRELGGWLFDSIVKEMNKLPSELRVTLRGPVEIGPIVGDTDNARDDHAAQLAADHNITLLIYGVITGTNGNFYVQPTFYVAADRASFNQAREITGPSRLGQPVPFTLPLDDPSILATTNAKLLARVKVLQYLVAGLAHLYIDENELAWSEFRRAAESPSWEAGEGQEVAYLLQGAAKMDAYSPAAAIEERRRLLDEAEAAYRQAHDLNPAYARSYLGLGAVALAGATLGQSDAEAKLNEAQMWFEQSLDALEQPPLARVPAKAHYGLGQTHMTGYQAGYPGWTADQAIAYFKQVIDDYNTAPHPDLTRIAGTAHVFVGSLAGASKADWTLMASEIKTGIEILEDMPGAPPQDRIALYWTWVAYAEEKRNDITAARDAYQRAIHLAEQLAESHQKVFTATDLEHWRAELKRLEGAP
ncbi:MAG: tetratricopeptide repeat protein [Chloroflexi bacterium]|nr:tetratricopeptide repeat protein [Chloroflexota bacterium]